MIARAPAEPGEVVAGKYVVKGVIGRGGAGVVVAADHKTLRCPVALKFLRPDIAPEPKAVERFLREAHAVARLRSEHVARVMDADTTEDGTAYLVMELLEGRDFAALVKEEGPLRVGTAVDYLIQACDAVAEAHGLGIVHRDIKSANLFLTRRADGSPLVKVLDFGLSKIERTPSQPSLTADNHVVGSPHFMSPEQMRSSREVDARSDIWSLGVVLYTMLAGKVPFEGLYLTEVCAAVLSGAAPKLSSVRPDVPEEVSAVVERCLQLEPEDRFQTVAELVAALAPLADASTGGPVSAPRSMTRPVQSTARQATPVPVTGPPPAGEKLGSRRKPALIAACGVAVAVLALVTIFWRAPASTAAAPPPPPVLAPASQAPPAATPVATPVATAPAIAAAPAAALPTPAPATRAPIAPRRSTGSGARRAPPPAAPPPAAAPAPPAARPAPAPKSDEAVILALPH